MTDYTKQTNNRLSFFLDPEQPLYVDLAINGVFVIEDRYLLDIVTTICEYALRRGILTDQQDWQVVRCLLRVMRLLQRDLNQLYPGGNHTLPLIRPLEDNDNGDKPQKNSAQATKRQKTKATAR